MKVFSWVIAVIFFLNLNHNLHGKDQSVQFYHFTNEMGLPSSYVKSITQDKYGFIWLATRISVSRFDGKQFQDFPAYDEDGREVKIFCNKLFYYNDSLLIARTNQGSFFVFDNDLETFKAYALLNSIPDIQSFNVTRNGFWISTSKEIFHLNPVSGEKKSINELIPQFKTAGGYTYLSSLGDEDHLAVLTNSNELIWFSFSSSVFKICPLPQLNTSSSLQLFYLDKASRIWFGEENNGVFRYNPDNNSYQQFSKDQPEPYTIPHNLVHCLKEDNQNRIWIGTEAGISIYDVLQEKNTICSYDPANPQGLNTDPIYDAFCDKDGNMWLGTYFGGVNFWSAKDKFFRTWNSGFGDWHLGGNVVSCLTEDRNGNLWVGLEDMGLNKIDLTTGEVRHYTMKEGLSYNNLHDILFVSDTKLWIATYTGGINILDTESGKIAHLNKNNVPQILSDNIYSFLKVGDTVLISSTYGVTLYDTNSQRFSRLKDDVLRNIQIESMTRTGNILWLSSLENIYRYNLDTKSIQLFDRIPGMTNINFVKADSKGRIWIGDSYQGLACYDIKANRITKFNTETGFPVSWMFSLEEGNDGWFWASSDKGLVKFNPESGVSILYDSNSGVPFNQFNYRASFTDNSGNIYFGGNSGMVSFNEKENPQTVKENGVVMTGFQLFNTSVRPGPKSPLKKSINETDRIVLRYDQNVFTIEYSALNYSLSGRSQYAYYLEGFETNWNYVGNRDFATYTNLSPGTYTFHVKGSGYNVQELTNDTRLKIEVLPPYWLTNWAFMLYFLLALIFSYIIYKVGKNLAQSKVLIEMERREKEHADEIHKVKLEFFTNISHELRTPLTLILGPIRYIIDEDRLSPNSRKKLLGVEKNAKRLFQLINQLLEFRKIENGKEKLQVIETNIRSVVDEISDSFSNIAESKDIDFVTSLPVKNSMVWVDPGKLDKIVFNLLSNAFKFTEAGGRVEFSASIVNSKSRSRYENNVLIIKISDSGRGIKPEMLDRVFDRFFQIEENLSKGSGIGLAYVKSLVILHKGEIKVDSEVGKGTTFTVSLPASRIAYDKTEILDHILQYEHATENSDALFDINEEKKRIDSDGLSSLPLVMVVEDNRELLDFMKEVLEPNYQVVTALNGIEALKKMEKIIPDLIVSDVMMPEMNGFDLTGKIKTNLNTSHIPVILLTAKSGVEDRIKGMSTGADYYIEKPFYPEILEKNIENIISTRKKLIERFKNDAYVQISDMDISESDKSFMEKLTNIIRKNISDSTMDVGYLVNEMGLSRSLLHMKLKGLINCSTTEYIRAVRLKEAVKLIASGKCNISEAAYETGFSSPTYFTRRFKEFYGKPPREYFEMNN
ncbi:two-component regulator propeller domain-containing protein [Saccharicrinis sp. FJH54]|uniref:hybrid sensor histidine kinase/response regulator transcription factor n=1 Tax=Saccharicrinis sp. FJH54 TaxID=3344665 RepID=UPI0035D49AB7